MRIAYGLFVAAAFYAGGATASSIVVLPAADINVSASMVAIPAMPAGAASVAILYPSNPGATDGSIIALGEPVPAAETVVASEEKRAAPVSAVMVIRGGVVGDAVASSTAPAPAEPASATVPATGAMPEPQTASAPAEPAPVQEPAVSEGAAAPAPEPAVVRDPE